MWEAAGSAGTTTVMVESLTTVKSVVLTGPKPTSVAPVKPEPVMVMVFPPVVDPEDADRPVTTGTGAETTKVYRSAATTALVPPGPVTATLWVAAGSAGTRAVIVESLTTVTSVELAGPKPTLVAPVNPDP